MAKARKWAVLGRLAVIARSRASAQPALAIETSIAQRFGLSRGTLRNYADAVNLVRRIPDPELRSMLLQSSAIGASTAARWFLRDPSGLYYHLASGVVGTDPRGIVDDRALLAAERAARATTPSLQSSRRDVSPDLQHQLGRLVQFPFTEWRRDLVRVIPWLGNMQPKVRLRSPEDPLGRFLGVSHVLTAPMVSASFPHWPESETDIDLAVIDIPRRVVLERYRREAREIWPRAVAASLRYRVVILVLPDSAARRHLLSQVPQDGAAWYNHPMHRVETRRSAPSCQSLPVVAQLQPHGGTILVATRRSLPLDLVQ